MPIVYKWLMRFKYELLVWLVFVLSRLPNLGNDTFNTDVWKWKARIYDFGSGVFGLNFPQTIQKYHPGVTLMWLGTVAVKVYSFWYKVVLGTLPLDNDITTVFELHFLQKLFVVMGIAIAVAFVFYALRSMFGNYYAILAVVLMSLEPFYVALTREIHLEGLMTTFMLGSMIWFYYYLTNPAFKRRLVVSAVFTSLAVLTKTSALYMLPFIGLSAFAWHYVDNVGGRVRVRFISAVVKALKMYWVWLVVAAVGFIAVWPAMWVVPFEAIKVMYRGVAEIGLERGHEQFYFNKYVTDPGFSYYFVVLGFKSSIALLVGLVGSIVVFKKLSTAKKRFLIYTLVFSILYMLMVSLSSKKLDRYILPSICGFILIGTFFYEWVLDRAKKFKVILTLVLFVVLAASLVYIHPDYLSYYNPMFGGLKTGIFVLEPKWIIGQQEIVRFFEAEKSAFNYQDFMPGENMDKMLNKPELATKMTVAFPEKYYTQIWPFIRKIGGWAVISDLTPQAVKTTYFVYPVWEDDSTNEDRLKLESVGTIKLRGVDVYRVMKRID